MSDGSPSPGQTAQSNQSNQPNISILSLSSSEAQRAYHEATLSHTNFLAKQKHKPVAILIGIAVFLVLTISLYFFTKWRFAQIVDEKIPKDKKSVDGTVANPALKSSLSGMDGLQMALLFGSAAVAMGCGFAYLLAKKRSELEQGLALHAKTTANLAQAELDYSKVGALGGL